MAHPGFHALHRPHDVALVLWPSGETVTWSELRRRVVIAANTLHDLGVRAGTSVAWCVENRADFVVLVWACLDAGFRFTPVSTRLTDDERSYIIRDCGARVFVHSANCGVPGAAIDGVTVVDIDSDASWCGRSTDAEGDIVPRYERVEGVPMLYSSGTTGRPKGVWRAAPEAPVEELSPSDSLLARAYGIDSTSVYLSPAPLYHSAPLTFLILMGRVGASTVVMEHFDPHDALTCIETYRVTHSQWVPTMFVRMLRLDPEVRARFDLSSHVFAIHGAGPCPIPVKEAMLDWWGPIIFEYYAGTEGAGTCVIGPHEWVSHKGSVGRSIRGPVKIFDDAGLELPPGEVGQVWFANSSDFHYFNDASKTAESRDATRGGTFGDLGYVDAEGYLYLTGRKSFTIIVGGVNVYPREVEEVLLAHPLVRDAAVFGLPDDEYGEQVKAVVEPMTQQFDHGDLERDLIAFCREHLATFKLPRSIDFMHELPREPTGKLRTAVLRQSYL